VNILTRANPYETALIYLAAAATVGKHSLTLGVSDIE
jgi:hypothetical protein